MDIEWMDQTAMDIGGTDLNDISEEKNVKMRK